MQYKCPGKTLKIQQISPLVKNYMLFAKRNTPKNIQHSYEKNVMFTAALTLPLSFFSVVELFCKQGTSETIHRGGRARGDSARLAIFLSSRQSVRLIEVCNYSYISVADVIISTHHDAVECSGCWVV